MKIKRIILTVVAVGLSVASAFTAVAQDSKLVQAKFIVNGLFFDASAPKSSIVPGGSTMAILMDPENKSVFAVYLPQGYELESDIVAKAIPAENVKYAAELLKDYNARRPDTTALYKGIGVEVGKAFPKFEYSDTENNVWNNAALKGKVWVLNLWQRECGPCRKEMPVLSTWKEKFPEVMFFSASRHDAAEIRTITEHHSFTLTHLQQATELVKLVGNQGFPLTVVVDKEGVVRFAKVGATEENQAAALAVIEQLAK